MSSQTLEKQTTKLKRCFIAAPVNIDTSPLRRVLEECGVQWIDAVSAEPGSSIMGTVEEAIARCDFVCALLPDRADRNNVAFEVGMAIGQGKPVLLLAERDAELPFDAAQVPYARVGFADKEAIAFHVDAFRRHAAQPSQPAVTLRKRPRKTDVDWARKELQQLSELPARERGAHFEDLVYRLFENAGLIAVQSPNGPASRVDMAVWMDDLQSTIGNPIIVECKVGRMTKDRIRGVFEQLTELMNRTHAPAAVLVTAEALHLPAPSRTPLVFPISIDQLIDMISEDSLSESLLRMRNEIVHGKR